MRIKEQLKVARKLMKLPPGDFEKVNFKDNPHAPKCMTRCFINNHYCVMIFDGHLTSHKTTAIKVMIQRHDDAPIHQWSELQHIKNVIFGKETVAIEYYPKQSELIDMANIYWLWIYPEGVLPVPVFFD